MKKYILILIISLLIAITFIQIEQSKVKVRFETLTSNEINESYRDLKIVYFSDLYLDQKNFSTITKTVSSINKLDPDIVIFGGNLFLDINDSKNTDIIKDNVSTLLKDINAKLNKYAILGSNDTTNTKDILFNSNFEIITNKTINIKENNLTLSFINDSSFKPILNPSTYNIGIYNNPDLYDSYLDSNFDYAIAGKTLGGGIYIPFFTEVLTKDQNYIKGKHHKSFTLDITSGLGNNNYNFRLLTDKEIVLYTISHLEESLNQ